MKTVKKKFKQSILRKLILSFLFVVIFTGVASIGIGYIVINNNIYGQAKSAVHAYLNTAQYTYSNKVKSIHLFMDHLASLESVKQAVAVKNRNALVRNLKHVTDKLSLDILTITDPAGKVIVRIRNPRLFGDTVSNDLFIRRIIKTGKSCSGTDIVSKEYLQREGIPLADQSFITVVPTEKARSRDKKYEERGMVLKAAAPILINNRVVGILYGAKLLNKNFDFVDELHDLAFKDEQFAELNMATATIFLDDVRISTNVKNTDGSRALGTRVSKEVYEQVFEQGKLWLGRAFVVNNWYIAAYKPIYNIQEKIIGIIYVGILEKKYSQMKQDTTILFLSVSLIAGGISVVLSTYIIRSTIVPYNYLIKAAREIGKGNYNNKIETNSTDEVGYLIKVFNQMMDAINERDTKLKEHTEQQIVQSEKLASLGRLASGIAHEINNPLTGVLTYSSLLAEEIDNESHKEDLDVIVKETLRCREIVKGMLDFARETKLEKQVININTVIGDSLAILENLVNFRNITIKKELSGSLPELNVDVNQMKSIFNNLAVNAADAMPQGGELFIKTYYTSNNNNVVIEFADTGSGISEENLSKVFDPFFTTKETGKGTGLGLAVTYGIIQRHGGSIAIDTQPGAGTQFTIELPVE
ncbi:MAG: HAMP domain-containing protein [bacterium]|nr:HAMP domain-containing protein [bacterium]